MISGINVNDTIDYILKDTKEDSANPTIWKLGLCPSYVYARIQISESSIDWAYMLCRVGIKGWSNLKGVEYKTEKTKIGGMEMDAIPLDLISKIPDRFLAELFSKLKTMNELTEDEKKN
jgi:hypothetical protein